MFPKNKINIIFRLLCLISYIIVIFVTNSARTLVIIGVIYALFALGEMSFRNIELIVISIVLLWISHLLDNYILFRIILLIDYCFYFLDTTYYYVEEKPIKKEFNEKNYIRFKNTREKKKKGSSNINAIYLTVHLVLLFLAIMVG